MTNIQQAAYNNTLGHGAINPFTQASFGEGIGNILTGNLDYQRQLDSMNISNAFNASQAELQRNWESNMSNTAYQRAVADMAAAGLNPYLAYNQGGAATPSGASAHASSPSAIQAGKGAASIMGVVLAAAIGLAGKAISASTAANNAALSSNTTLQAQAMRDAVLTQNAALAASTSATNARLASDTSLEAAKLRADAAIKSGELAAATSASNAKLRADTSIQTAKHHDATLSKNAKLRADTSYNIAGMRGSDMAKVANIKRAGNMDVALLYKAGILPSGETIASKYGYATHFKPVDEETARILRSIKVRK